MSEEFKLEYTKPDQTYKVIDAFNPVDEPEPEYEYFLVDVEKTLVTTIAVKCLVDNNFGGMMKAEQLDSVRDIIADSTDPGVISLRGLYVANVKKVNEQTAQLYGIDEI
jgi:hypothetical protein